MVGADFCWVVLLVEWFLPPPCCLVVGRPAAHPNPPS